MKKVVTVGIGRKSFVIDDDAYQRLSIYLARFKEQTGMGKETADVMEDLEERIAELFTEALGSKYQVVNISMVNTIVSQLGMPDGSSMEDFSTPREETPYRPPVKKLYRDSDDKVIGGVCSGLALYLNVDVVIIRILFVVALVVGGTGFWAYVVFWIVAPLAYTAAQKCEMRGIPATAENLRKFSSYR
ncbi:MAG: PspC domain-containing protein [Bacteroidales bacterium]|jgi:phage shock protein PspC (stress-responsive transcriptional regulator)|nr:PspC domain-containing protein [Bacteroidales bacterium]MDD3843066.1 PspC domain-containing protein [Bacteroidales bacterium]MDD4618335.1 PspC domain-containing protein [Bacteroidales bacterium]